MSENTTREAERFDTFRERIRAALRYLANSDGHMIYRGDRSTTWYVSGPGSPNVTFSKREIANAIESGWLTPRWLDEPKLEPDDALSITDDGREFAAKRDTP